MKRLRYLLTFILALGLVGGCGPLPDGYEESPALAIELEMAQDDLAEAQDALAHAESEQQRLIEQNAVLTAQINAVIEAQNRKAGDFFVACTDVEAANAPTPVVQGVHPLYGLMRDRDGDGSVCEGGGGD